MELLDVESPAAPQPNETTELNQDGGDAEAAGDNQTAQRLSVHRSSTVCIHGRQKSVCVPCGGRSICIHKRRRSRCPDCGGGSLCEHGKRDGRCKVINCSRAIRRSSRCPPLPSLTTSQSLQSKNSAWIVPPPRVGTRFDAGWMGLGGVDGASLPETIGPTDVLASMIPNNTPPLWLLSQARQAQALATQMYHMSQFARFAAASQMRVCFDAPRRTSPHPTDL